jgi:hypothetical protein
MPNGQMILICSACDTAAVNAIALAIKNFFI